MVSAFFRVHGKDAGAVSHPATAARYHPSDFFSGFRVDGERVVTHLLLNFVGPDFLTLFLRDGFVNVCCHGILDIR